MSRGVNRPAVWVALMLLLSVAVSAFSPMQKRTASNVDVAITLATDSDGANHPGPDNSTTPSTMVVVEEDSEHPALLVESREFLASVVLPREAVLEELHPPVPFRASTPQTPPPNRA